MTPQEQQLLQGLVDRVNQTVLSEKDPDAEQFIQQSLSRNPDALYILAQTVLVQQYALDQAKQQLDKAKQQAPQPKHATSFLGNLLGMNDEPAARPAPPPPSPQYAPVQAYAPQQGYAPQQAYPPQQPMSGGGFFGSGGQPQGGGFLQSAMRTATGVAAGALAFEGIESLMHGFGQHAGYGSGLGGFDGMGGGGHPEEIINNNYYGDATPGEHSGHGDLADRFAANGDQPSSDVEDRRDNFADTSSDDSSDNFADTSDNNADDSSFADDTSSDSDAGSNDDSSF